MADKVQIKFTKKSLKRFNRQWKELRQVTTRWVKRDFVSFMREYFKSRVLKFIFRELIKLAGKLVVREAAIGAAGAAGGVAGGAPGAVIVIVGNVVLLIWTVSDIAKLVINFRVILRDRQKSTPGKTKVDLKTVKKDLKPKRTRGKGTRKRVKTPVAEPPKERVPDFSFQSKSKVRSPSFIRALMNAIVRKGVKEAEKELIKEWRAT